MSSNLTNPSYHIHEPLRGSRSPG